MNATTINNRKDHGRIIDGNDRSVEARYRLNDIFCGAWLSHAVSAVAEHGIADLIEEEPVHYTQLAARNGLHAPTLYRVMRALAAHNIFRETPEGAFEHTEISRLLRSDNPYSWRGMARMWGHPSCLTAWRHFPECLADGRSGIEHAFGVPLYLHLGEHPNATQSFAGAMISNSAHASESIAKQFPFQKYSSVCDLAGGVGTLLLAILGEHKHLRGTLYEIPDLKAAALDSINKAGLRDRCDFVAGDFLSHVPPENDLYMVKNSLWNWDDEHCLSIIKNTRAAIGTARGARFVIIEYVIDDHNKSWSTLYDLQILNMPGGRARTQREYDELLARGGFRTESVQFIEDQTLIVAEPV